MNELAELMGLSPGFVGLLERGQRGTSPLTLLQLSLILGTSIDQLFYCGNVSVSPCDDQTDTNEIETKIQIRLEKLRNLIYDFNEKEMGFVLEFLEYYRVIRHDENVSMNQFYYTF